LKGLRGNERLRPQFKARLKKKGGVEKKKVKGFGAQVGVHMKHGEVVNKSGVKRRWLAQRKKRKKGPLLISGMSRTWGP